MGGVIAVIDDDEAMRELVRYRLRNDGYEVLSFEHGAAVWEALDGGSIDPDLIVSDVMMPGLDGITLLKRLRADERFEELPVVLLTARGREEDVLEGFESGVSDYLTKPFRPNELLARVRRSLR